VILPYAECSKNRPFLEHFVHFWIYTLEDQYKLMFLYALTTSLQDPIIKPKVVAIITHKTKRGISILIDVCCRGQFKSPSCEASSWCSKFAKSHQFQVFRRNTELTQDHAMVGLLLQHGADPNEHGPEGTEYWKTPWERHLAVAFNPLDLAADNYDGTFETSRDISSLEYAMPWELEMIQTTRIFLQHGADPSRLIPEHYLHYWEDRDEIGFDDPRYSLPEAIRKYIAYLKELYVRRRRAKPHAKALFLKAIEQWEEVAQLASEKLAEFVTSKEVQGPQEAQISQGTSSRSSQEARNMKETDAQASEPSSAEASPQDGTNHGDESQTTHQENQEETRGSLPGLSTEEANQAEAPRRETTSSEMDSSLQDMTSHFQDGISTPQPQPESETGQHQANVTATSMSETAPIAAQTSQTEQRRRSQR